MASLSALVVGGAHKLPFGRLVCDDEGGGGAESVGEGAATGIVAFLDREDRVLPDIVGRKGSKETT
jgi:hypothetical protein